MFHSSSFRHEQYIRSTISNSSKATLHKKRSSLESEGGDSGYNSSSSISPSTIEQKDHVTSTARGDASIISSSSTTKSSTFTDTSLYLQQQQKIKKSKSSSIKHQPPRQPDLVYSCPRPLAFPFHNDDHFLPIAEADPRDVARVSPMSSSLLNRSSSINSTNSTARLLKKDTDSSYSRHSSILSSIQRGTVRSLRSLFQLQDTASDTISRVQSTTTSNHQRLEIKQGTVQSIRNLFKRTSTPTASSSIPPTPPAKKGLVSKAIHQFESKQKASPVMGLKVNVTPSTHNRKSSITQRAKDLKSKLFNASTENTIKNISQKVFPWKKTNTTTTTTATTIPKTSFTKTKNDNVPKKSFFSFKKSTPTIDKKPDTQTSTTIEAESTTTVKKMWKSFKNLVTGKKSSRIGIM